MISKNLLIKNPTGLHLRPAGILCKVAMEYESKITFEVRGNVANAKSVLSVLGSCVKCGDELHFTFDGVDEQEALEKITVLIDSGIVKA